MWFSTFRNSNKPHGGLFEREASIIYSMAQISPYNNKQTFLKFDECKHFA